MAYKLTWSPAARDDLLDIVTFISRDSPSRAETFAYRLYPRNHSPILPDCLPRRSSAEAPGDCASMARS